MGLFSRNILGELDLWRESASRKPMLLRGARQVGKTTAIQLFSAGFDQYIYLNLEREEDARLFREIREFPKLLEALFFLKSAVRKGGATLIFIDEIQQVPHAVSMLRYFHEDAPDLYVIAAGSLLETLLNDSVTVPVGRVEYRVIRPVSFREFLIATGEDSALAIYDSVPYPDFGYHRLMELFNRYAFIGGMPEAVENYAQHRDLTLLKPIYESLLISYLDDVEKYARNVTLTQVIRHTIRASFGEAGKRIVFQNFGHSNYGSREVGEAFRTLEKAMLLHLVYPTVYPVIPVLPDLKKSPRLQVIDTGLMNHFAGLHAELIPVNNLLDVYQGKMIEHLVGQEILASHLNVLFQLCFWVRQKKDSSAETDFVLEVDGNVVPVEVKSGTAGKLRSLHLFMEQAPHTFAVRLYHGRLQRDHVRTSSGKVYTLLSLPYFLAGRLEPYIRWMMKEG